MQAFVVIQYILAHNTHSQCHRRLARRAVASLSHSDQSVVSSSDGMPPRGRTLTRAKGDEKGSIGTTLWAIAKQRASQLDISLKGRPAIRLWRMSRPPIATRRPRRKRRQLTHISTYDQVDRAMLDRQAYLPEYTWRGKLSDDGLDIAQYVKLACAAAHADGGY